MKILIAVDRSPFAPALINAVCTRRWPRDAQFYILTVCEETTGWFSNQEYVGPAAHTEQRQKLESYVGDLAMQLKRRLPSHLIFSDVCTGAPVEQILKAVRELSIDLIIVGQQGTNNAGGSSIGGVAETIVHKAPCSVEVVKPKVEVTTDGIQLAATAV